MSSTRVLPAGTRAASAARRFVEEQVCDAGLLEDALVVASELVANACSYGDPPITITIGQQDATTDEHGVRVTVSNQCRPDQPTWPHLVRREITTAGSSSPLMEGGRGLRLVTQVAENWGWQIDDGTMTVWALISGTQRTSP